jgi:hypothetical protein
MVAEGVRSESVARAQDGSRLRKSDRKEPMGVMMLLSPLSLLGGTLCGTRRYVAVGTTMDKQVSDCRWYTRPRPATSKRKLIWYEARSKCTSSSCIWSTSVNEGQIDGRK